jgi:hypothetical protein
VGSIDAPTKLFIILQILERVNQKETRHQTGNCTNTIERLFL